MSAWVFFDCFSEDLISAVHNFSSDTLMIALTNTAPDYANDTVLADLTPITEENGYTPADVGASISRSGAVTTLAGTDITFTASGGTFGPYRYAVLYNATATGSPLICYTDKGTSITTLDGDPCIIDFPDTGIATFGA